MVVVGYDGTRPTRLALDRAGELLRSREVVLSTNDSPWIADRS
jgi:hypothetical protein